MTSSEGEPLIPPTQPLEQDEESAEAAEEEEAAGSGKTSYFTGFFSGMTSKVAATKTKASANYATAKDQASANYATAKEKAAMKLEAVNDARLCFNERVGQRIEQSKLDAERKLFELSEPVRLKILMAIRESIKNSIISDPDMCECIKGRVSGLVDLFWDDLRKTIDKALDDSKTAIGDKTLVSEADRLADYGRPPCICSPAWLRAHFLYHLIPFDLSIFGNLKDPLYFVHLFFMCLANFFFLPAPWNAVPVRVPFFVVYLIMLSRNPTSGNSTDRSADEYQLVLFIMSIKGLQFVSSGVLVMCVAALQYYICVSPDLSHTCDKHGPGVTIPAMVSLLDWCGISVLVWTAFLMLPFSVRSAGVRDGPEDDLDAEVGRSTNAGASSSNNVATTTGKKKSRASVEKDEEEVGQSSCCCGCRRDHEKGGRLAAWLRYDFLCFLISAIFLVLLILIDAWKLRPEGERKLHLHNLKLEIDFAKQIDWAAIDSFQGRTAIFWARMVYSMLSLPFVLFWIPGLQGILTHTRLTGYNKNGYCVPYTLREVKDKTK